MVTWFWTTRFDELSYHTMGAPKEVDIGDAIHFDSMRADVPENSFVSVSGVLGNKAATLNGLRAGSLRYGPYQVRHLLGSKIYIEYDQEKYHASFSPFSRVNVEGRLTSFGPKSELLKVRNFFKSYYGIDVADDAMLVVMDEKPKTEWRYLILFCISLILLMLSTYFSIQAFRNARKHED